MASTGGVLVLRAAVAEDAEAIAAIWWEGWKDGHLGGVPDELVAVRTEESFGKRAQERIGDTTVAVLDGAIAGFIMVVKDEVEQVYVSREHRGRGVSQLLLKEAEEQVGRNGYTAAWLAVVASNSRARAFYSRCGWKDDGAFDYQASSASGPIPVPAHRYVKHLTNGSAHKAVASS